MHYTQHLQTQRPSLHEIYAVLLKEVVYRAGPNAWISSYTGQVAILALSSTQAGDQPGPWTDPAE